MRGTQGPETRASSTAGQDAALAAAAAAATNQLASVLLRDSGPLGKVEANVRWGRSLEQALTAGAAQGKGLTAEASFLVNLQGASSRQALPDRFFLSHAANDPAADIRRRVAGRDFGYQLKVGGEIYTRRASRKHTGDAQLIVSSTFADVGWRGRAEASVIVGNARVRMRSKAEEDSAAREHLRRLAERGAAVGPADHLRWAGGAGLRAGAFGASIEAVRQVLTQRKQREWHRVGIAGVMGAVHGGLTSLASSWLASRAVMRSGRDVILAPLFRGARLLGAAVPRLLSLGTELLGGPDGGALRRSFFRHTGGLLVELTGFGLLSSFALGLGGIVGTVVLFAGGALLDCLGGVLGEVIHDLLWTPPEPRFVEDVGAIEDRRCSASGCRDRHHARGMCKRHYDAWHWRHRDLFARASVPGPVHVNVVEPPANLP